MRQPCRFRITIKSLGHEITSVQPSPNISKDQPSRNVPTTWLGKGCQNAQFRIEYGCPTGYLQYISGSGMQQLFNEVVHQFQSANQYDKFIKQAVKEYDIKIYRLHQVSLEQASLIYKQLQQRYQHNLIERMPQGWHENERRLYIWFIVCYIHLRLLEPVKLVDNDKHWKHISHVFWDKDVFFLKYQLQTIIKIRARTVWKTTEDDLLREIYLKHGKGEWNQVAKDFYFQTKGQYFKSPKQCRERWQNHLNNQINKGDWTKQEDRVLFHEVRTHGTKWARIIPLLKNARTEHMIKNRYKALLNKEMYGKSMTQSQAVIAILRKINEDIGYKEEKSVKVVVEPKKTEIQNEIEFVQSEQIYEEVQQTKRKRGRPRKQDKKQLQSSKIKIQPQRSFEKNNNLQKLAELEGCVVMGPQMPYLHKFLLNSQKSDSFFGQSNSFLRSSSHQMFNSGHYSINNSLKFPCDDKSMIGLDQFTIKEENGKYEKKAFENSSLHSFKSYNSARVRPNESFISKLINY